MLNILFLILSRWLRLIESSFFQGRTVDSRTTVEISADERTVGDEGPTDYEGGPSRISLCSKVIPFNVEKKAVML